MLLTILLQDMRGAKLSLRYKIEKNGDLYQPTFEYIARDFCLREEVHNVRYSLIADLQMLTAF